MIDITGCINHSALISFADDTKIWKGITTSEIEAHLQEDLERVYVWAEQNNMSFNSKKFQAIRFAEIVSHPLYTNDIGAFIEEAVLVKDLGIHMSTDMKFDKHIRIVATRGKRTAGWITRVFLTRCPGVMLILLKQLVYPTVEYNCVLWSPKSLSLINLLESVQRNFIKKIKADNIPANSDYWDLLKHFKLYSMQRRGERYAIFYVWKVIHNMYPNPGLYLNTTTEDHKVHPNHGIFIDSHQRRGFTTHHESNPPAWLEDLSVLTTCCELYNLLPQALRQPLPADKEPFFPDFKEEVDKWLTTIPDQPSCPGRTKLASSNSLIHQFEYRQR